MHIVDVDADGIIDEIGDTKLVPAWGADPLQDYDGHMIDMSAGSFGDDPLRDFDGQMVDMSQGSFGAAAGKPHNRMTAWWKSTHPGQPLPPYWSAANVAEYQQWAATHPVTRHHGEPGPDQELPGDAGVTPEDCGPDTELMSHWGADPLLDYDGHMVDMSQGSFGDDAPAPPSGHALNFAALQGWLTAHASDSAVHSSVLACFRQFGHPKVADFASQSAVNFCKAVQAALTTSAGTPNLRHCLISTLKSHGATVSFGGHHHHRAHGDFGGALQQQPMRRLG